MSTIDGTVNALVNAVIYAPMRALRRHCTLPACGWCNAPRSSCCSSLSERWRQTSNKTKRRFVAKPVIDVCHDVTPLSLELRKRLASFMDIAASSPPFARHGHSLVEFNDAAADGQLLLLLLPCMSGPTNNCATWCYTTFIAPDRRFMHIGDVRAY